MNNDAIKFYNKVFAKGSYSKRRILPHISKIKKYLEFTSHISGPVLELGVGTGQLKDICDEYLGIDISVEALKNISDKLSACASGDELPIKSNSLKAVFTVAALEHFPCPDNALAEMHRCVQNGGVLYIAPAWHCRTWTSEGINVRPYQDLTFRQKLIKLTIPLRNSKLWRGIFVIPWRICRRLCFLTNQSKTQFKYKKLNANFEVFWCSDSDATCSLDSHEAILYFLSRGYKVLSHHGVIKQIFAGGEAVVVQKK